MWNCDWEYENQETLKQWYEKKSPGWAGFSSAENYLQGLWAGVRNMSAFIRKMAIDGYVINLELPELAECLRLARYTSNNVKQIARAVHSGGGVYPDDVNDICVQQDEINQLWGRFWNGSPG